MWNKQKEAAAVRERLKAIDKLSGESSDGARVVATMKAMPTDDPLFGKGLIRADGRKIHPNYVLRTKTASASKERWDYFDVIATVPAERFLVCRLRCEVRPASSSLAPFTGRLLD